MNTIKVLDVTLRDGGYVNNWEFGFDEAKSILETVYKSGVDYVEAGFIGEYVNEEGRVCFDTMDALSKVFLPSKAKICAMTYVDEYPVEKFPARSEKTVDMVRVIVYKRNYDDGIKYVRTLIEKGYDACVQLARTDQFDLSEIGDYVKRWNDVHPMAVYLVDSFGTYNASKTLAYAKEFDENLGEDIYLGFHAHNNMQQALTNVASFCEHPWKHRIILDASVLGMGRGAGNMNLEMLLNYLNVTMGKNYNLDPIIEVADKYIDKYSKQFEWGYSIPYFLCALNGCNHRFVHYLKDKNVGFTEMSKIFQEMKEDGTGIRFNTELLDELINQFCNK